MSINISNVSFFYNSSPIFENLNCSIKPRGFIGIIGPNGGGKTTLLKLMAGLLKPKSGIVTLDGKIGYVPQNTQANRNFPISVMEVVLLGAISECSILGTFKQSTKTRARQILDTLELSHLAKKPFCQLSGGEAQRTLIARALICDPEILFLDEPTANTDYEAEKKIFRLLFEYKKTKTILIVTHDLETLIHTADSVLVVNKNVIEYPPEKICRHFALGLYHTPLPEEK